MLDTRTVASGQPYLKSRLKSFAKAASRLECFYMAVEDTAKEQLDK